MVKNIKFNHGGDNEGASRLGVLLILQKGDKNIIISVFSLIRVNLC